MALVAAIGELTTLTAALKWPNDLLIGPEQRKAAGILAEAVSAPADRAVVVGMGINVSQDPAELPVRPGALPPTSLVAAGATDLSRQELAAALLGGVRHHRPAGPGGVPRRHRAHRRGRRRGRGRPVDRARPRRGAAVTVRG